MRDYNFNNLPAGESRTLQTEGTFFRVKESPVPVKVEYETLGGAEPATVTLSETGYFRLPYGIKFTRVYITNAGSAQADIVVTAGNGETGDNLQSGTVNSIASPADSFAGLTAITLSGSAETISGNANRRSITIRADQANTNPVWVGGTAADEGIPLYSGESTEVKVSGDIDIIGTSGEKIYLGEEV